MSDYKLNIDVSEREYELLQIIIGLRKRENNGVLQSLRENYNLLSADGAKELNNNEFYQHATELGNLYEKIQTAIDEAGKNE